MKYDCFRPAEDFKVLYSFIKSIQFFLKKIQTLHLQLVIYYQSFGKSFENAQPLPQTPDIEFVGLQPLSNITHQRDFSRPVLIQYLSKLE